MLAGDEAILLIQLFKLGPAADAALAKVPLLSTVVDKIGLPPIPIYLSRQLTGLIIDQSSKSIDIDTTLESSTLGDELAVEQKALGAITKINFIADKDSIGIMVLSALMDQILPLVTAKMYSITYLAGANTIFNATLHQFTVDETRNETLNHITLELSRGGTKKSTVPKPENSTEAVGLGQGQAPTEKLATPLKGPAGGASLPKKAPVQIQPAVSNRSL